MTRFKKGSMVEVLSKKDLWRCAKIVEDNGDAYTVKYYRCPGIAKDGVDKVSAKAVRPCPRPVMGTNNLVVGKVVEVLDDGYWRVSVIEEVLEDGYCYIKVIGSLDEFRVNNSSIRARQEWKQNKWILMDKDSENHVHNKSQQEVLESNLLSKSLKRSFSDHSSTAEAYAECVQKRRLGDEEVELDAIDGDAYSFNGKVDNPANQRGNLGKDNVQNFTEKTIRFNKANTRNHNGFLGLDDCVSSVSSVGSCSITNAISDRLLSHSSAGSRQDSASLCSDAESHSHLGVEEEMSDGPVQTCKPYSHNLKDDVVVSHLLCNIEKGESSAMAPL
ncbi:hypothetical protein SOVF_181120 [Spinacia oleracea]|nr:hypothetical protein SOVF_181120 [Spinacia oleracea]